MMGTVGNHKLGIVGTVDTATVAVSVGNNSGISILPVQLYSRCEEFCHFHWNLSVASLDLSHYFSGM